MIPKPSLMRDAYRTINEIYREIDNEANQEINNDVSPRDKRSVLNDIQGDVYENLLEELKTAGKTDSFVHVHTLYNWLSS